MASIKRKHNQSLFILLLFIFSCNNVTEKKSENQDSYKPIYDSTIIGKWVYKSAVGTKYVSGHNIVEFTTTHTTLLGDPIAYSLTGDSLNLLLPPIPEEKMPYKVTYNKFTLDIQYVGTEQNTTTHYSFIRYDPESIKNKENSKNRSSNSEAYYKWPCKRCGKQLHMNEVLSPNQGVYTAENGFAFCSQECWHAFQNLGH